MGVFESPTNLPFRFTVHKLLCHQASPACHYQWNSSRRPCPASVLQRPAPAPAPGSLRLAWEPSPSALYPAKSLLASRQTCCTPLPTAPRFVYLPPSPYPQRSPSARDPAHSSGHHCFGTCSDGQLQPPFHRALSLLTLPGALTDATRFIH